MLQWIKVLKLLGNLKCANEELMNQRMNESDMDGRRVQRQIFLGVLGRAKKTCNTRSLELTDIKVKCKDREKHSEFENVASSDIILMKYYQAYF